MSHTKEMRDECVRLRREERMGLSELSQKTGVSRGTLSGWLKKYPLKSEEILGRMRKSALRTATLTKKSQGEKSRLFEKLASSRKYSTNQKGNIAESAVLLRLLLVRLRVLSPAFEGDKTDWVVITPNNQIFKIQVKCCLETSSSPCVSLRSPSTSIQYQEGDFDFIVGYDLYTDTAYVWSWDDVKLLHSSVSVCPEAEEAWHKIGVF